MKRHALFRGAAHVVFEHIVTGEQVSSQPIVLPSAPATLLHPIALLSFSLALLLSFSSPLPLSSSSALVLSCSPLPHSVNPSHLQPHVASKIMASLLPLYPPSSRMWPSVFSPRCPTFIRISNSHIPWSLNHRSNIAFIHLRIFFFFFAFLPNPATGGGRVHSTLLRLLRTLSPNLTRSKNQRRASSAAF